MPTFKVLINAQRRRADGTYSVRIRLTHNRIVRFIPTPLTVEAAQVTKTGKIKDDRVMKSAEAIVRHYRDLCNERAEDVSGMDADALRRMLMEKARPEGGGFSLDMVGYMRSRAEALQAEGRSGSAAAMERAAASLAGYSGGSVDVNSITRRYIAAWRAWIVAEARRRGYQGESAAWAYAVQLRTAFNLAKREYNDDDAGVINIPRSPFDGMERPMCVRQGAAHKRAIGLQDMLRIIALPRRAAWAKGNTDFNLARDCFLLSFMLLGMNPADMYECPPAADGRLTYCRRKTRRRRVDGAELSVRLEPEAAVLLERYADGSGVRAFDFYRRYRTYKSFYNALTRGMHLLGEAAGLPGLQFYAARHTWATLAVNLAGVDKYSVHEALNHSSGAMAITDVYIRRDWAGIDRAARAVLDLFPAVVAWAGDHDNPTYENAKDFQGSHGFAHIPC